MGTGSFPEVKCGQGVLLTTHSLLVSQSWKSRTISLPTLWATPGLLRDHFTFLYQQYINCAWTSSVSSMRLCSWSRHCSSSRKVAGSASNGVVGIFNLLDPTDSTMAMGSTQPLNRNEAPGKADNLATFVWRLSKNSGSHNFLEP